MSDLSNRILTDDYVHHLATRIAGRLREGLDLPDALGETLRERAPVRLDLPRDDSGTSLFGWVLRLGLLAGAGLAANYAAKSFLGQDLASLARGQKDDETGYRVDEKYSAVHGTAGAEMPTPRSSTTGVGTSAGASAFASPRPATEFSSSGTSTAGTSPRTTTAGTPAPQTPPVSPSGSTTGGSTKSKDKAPAVKDTSGGEMPESGSASKR